MKVRVMELAQVQKTRASGEPESLQNYEDIKDKACYQEIKNSDGTLVYPEIK